MRTSLEKPKYREKLRLRCYKTPMEDSQSFVEIKKKVDGVAYKRRADLPYTIDGTNLTINAAGTYTRSSGDDGVHAGEVLTLGVQDSENGPDMTVTASYEGLEGAVIALYSGRGSIIARDDGINAANGDLDRSYAFTLDIYGRNWYVNTERDALDSNGHINFYGGVTEFYGAANNGNSALDYDGSCDDQVGSFLAVGAAGMAQAPSTGTYVAFGSIGTGGGMGGQHPGQTDDGKQLQQPTGTMEPPDSAQGSTA